MKSSMFLILILTLSANIYARSCNEDEYDRVKYYADITSNKIVQKYKGGRHIDVKVFSCEYNTYSKQIKAEIEVKWQGEYLSSNTYISRGYLIVDAYDNHGSYKETFANGNLQNFKGLLQLIGYTEIILDLP